MANTITAGNATNNGTAVTSDNSGTLQLLTGSGAGAVALTLDASQNATVAGTLAVSGASATVGGRSVVAAGPMFNAYMGANQTMSAGIAALAAFDTETLDTANCFNNTNATVNGIPPYAFMPNVAGYYHVIASLGGSGATTAIYVGAYIYKNGVAIARNLTPAYSGTNSDTMSSRVVYMNGTTDYIQVYGQVQGTGTLNLTGQAGDIRSAFSAYFARP